MKKVEEFGKIFNKTLDRFGQTLKKKLDNLDKWDPWCILLNQSNYYFDCG